MSPRKCGPASLNRKRTASLKESLKTYMDILRYGEESVSVAMEEGKSQDWVEKVLKPDIQNKWDSLYKKPGYDVNDL